MIHVSGGDRKNDFLDDPLAPPKLPWLTLSRLIYFNIRNLAYLPIKTFKLRKLFEQFIFLLDGILARYHSRSFS